jgi:hypothetical protein
MHLEPVSFKFYLKLTGSMRDSAAAPDYGRASVIMSR